MVTSSEAEAFGGLGAGFLGVKIGVASHFFCGEGGFFTELKAWISGFGAEGSRLGSANLFWFIV